MSAGPVRHLRIVPPSDGHDDDAPLGDWQPPGGFPDQVAPLLKLVKWDEPDDDGRAA